MLLKDMTAALPQMKGPSHARHIKKQHSHLVCVLAADAAINLNPGSHTGIIAHLSQLAHLLYLVLNELLASKSRIHYKRTKATESQIR